MAFKLNSTVLSNPVGAWLTTIILIGAGLFSMRPIRADLHLVLSHPAFALELGTLVAALVVGTVSVALPNRLSRIAIHLTQVSLFAWASALVYRIFEKPTMLWGACHSGVSCSASVSLVTILAGVGFVVASKSTRAFVNSPHLFLIVSAFTLTAFEFVCASANPLHVALFHFMPTFFSCLILYAIFRWTVPK